MTDVLPPPGSAVTVFLDRDGVINRKRPEGRYVTVPAELDLLPGSVDAIARLTAAGLRVIVVTNQQGVAKGVIAPESLQRIHDLLRDEVAGAGGRLDAVLVCPHLAGTCDCRKPGTGLFEEARRRHPEIAFAAAVVVGDAPSDMAAAAAIGARAILVTDRPDPGFRSAGAPAEVPSLAAAADLILQETHARPD